MSDNELQQIRVPEETFTSDRETHPFIVSTGRISCRVFSSHGGSMDVGLGKPKNIGSPIDPFQTLRHPTMCASCARRRCTDGVTTGQGGTGGRGFVNNEVTIVLQRQRGDERRNSSIHTMDFSRSSKCKRSLFTGGGTLVSLQCVM